ncbi:MAG: dihydrofolate reductase [Pseudomonadales bacterium]|nr:dihydrofolate reductase [Candidatus Woesebacteria bacterium]MCB9801965.1 dihydrofolate reductase [Pseudomonadales bacterium]
MHVTLIVATSADGFIARKTEESSFDWTSPEDKQFYIQTIKEYKTVVMGSRSFQTFTRYPKGLRFIIYSRSPENFSNPKPHVITADATRVSPAELVETLRSEGVEKVLIAGGSSIYTQFFAAGVVDTLYITQEPVFFGQGVPLFTKSIEERVQLLSSRKLNDRGTLLLQYQVEK